jgi:methionine synthase II (cobalamin-independent)
MTSQDDATLLAIRDQERAGLDIITDGEQRRESYSNPSCGRSANLAAHRSQRVRSVTARLS